MSVTPRYARISVWCEISGMGRSVTYEELAQGKLRAIKLGSRTLIDVPHGLDYLASKPAAVINTKRARRPSVMKPPRRRRRRAEAEVPIADLLDVDLAVAAPGG